MKPIRRFFLLLGLAAVISVRAETVEFESGKYQVQRIPATERSRLHLRWVDSRGQPLTNFGALQKELSAEGKKILFATNAGLYEQGPRPCGLTICDGKGLVPLNLKDGFGNFYLKPNGVFFIDDSTGPGIAETGQYQALSVRPRLANQSGPLLLHRGVIHPAFMPASPNRRQRSAVGIVKASREIIFVMSQREDREKGRVTFHQLARLFLHLGCEDALFLDGNISQMIFSPADRTEFTPNTFAGMFVLTDR